MRYLLLEALVVASVGAVLAFAANGLRPYGIQLSRDYFPPASAPESVATNQAVSAGPAGTNSPAVQRSLAEEFQARGLQLADSNLVAQLYQDPRFEQGLLLFIDARDASHYQAGHIPGAHEFDYYQPNAYLATLVPLCQVAQQIVFYCNGGTCEDSMLAAVFLRDLAQIPKEKLFVYGGGFVEWSETNRMPVEIGARKSGQMRPSP